MKEDDTLYGLEGWENLTDSVPEAVRRIMEDYGGPSTSFDERAKSILWPLEVTVYRRAKLPDVEHIMSHALDAVLEWLDEEYAGPDNPNTKPTEAMNAAALELAKVVVRDYVSWACDATGAVVKVTREEARRMWA